MPGLSGLQQLLHQLRFEHPSPHDRGKAFEYVCKFYLENDPYFSGIFSDIWSWYDWPDRDGPEIGIDIVAKEKQNCNGFV